MTPNRRGFIQALMALPGVSWFVGNGAAAPAARDIYKELGVRPVINAAGTYTALGGSLMSLEVVAAMDAAARQFVHLEELQAAVGRKIAVMVGCEAALVSAGCASALTLGTAACVAGKDPARIRRLPDTSGMKNEVLIQKSHRNGYDHAVRNVGVRLIEVETAAELERAVNEHTAMLLFFDVHGPSGKIPLDEFARLGKKLGVPTFIDAAADLPPVDNLTRFLKMGFDLAAFSGGKGLRGPQNAGLLLGRKDLIEAAALNNNPHSDSIGRTNKVSKETLVGMCAALEQYLQRDHAADWKEWERRVQTIADMVVTVKGVRTESFVPPIANHVPHLRLAWDFKASGLTPAEVGKRLRDGEPAIEVQVTGEGIVVGVWMLEPGQDRIVGERLRSALRSS